MDFIDGVLYKVPTGEPVSIPLRHLGVFGVTRDSGKTTFIASAVAASERKAITFRTKRGEIGFKGARQLPIFFDERGLTHWKALEGLIAATLEEKVQREPGIRAAIIRVCRRPTQAKSLEEIHERVKERLNEKKLRGFERDVFDKLDAYLNEVLPQIKALRDRFTDRLELPEPGVYVEDLTGLSDELQSLLLASVMKKCYEELSGIIVVLPEVWKFLPQDRGSPVKWVIEKYLREMGAVEGYLWIDAQDLRGVDKKHLRSVDVRLFGRQPDPHEIDDLLKALPLPKRLKPQPEQIMTLKLGHFYGKLRDTVELVYVKPRWLPQECAIRVAKGELEPDSEEVQKFSPKVASRVLEVNDLVWKEKYDELKIKFDQLNIDHEKLQKKVDQLTRESFDIKALREDLAKSDELVSKLQHTDEEIKALETVKQAFAILVGPMSTGSEPGIHTGRPSVTLAEVDTRINQRLAAEPSRVVTVDVNERIKELVKEDYVSRLITKIQSLPQPAKKAALWLHEKKAVKIGELYSYMYDKTARRIPGSFYMNVVNPLQDAWLVFNEAGNVRWSLEEKLSAECKDVLRNGEVQEITKYLVSLLL